MEKWLKTTAIAMIVIGFSSLLLASEPWGVSEEITFIGGCDFFIANPTYYENSAMCFESSNLEHGFYRLMTGQLPGFDTPDEITSDSLNLDSINYTSPFMTYSGDKLYFSSDLPGGYGGYDIWVAEWLDNHWGAPSNLGPAINSEFHELGPSLPLAGDELYFVRNSNDFIDLDYYYKGEIYSSELIDNEWSLAFKVPEIINLSDRMSEPSISADGFKLYFCSFWTAYVSYRENGIWQEPEPLNDNINHDGGVYSLAIDSLGTSLLFTYYTVYDGFMIGTIRRSHLTVDVDDQPVLPSALNIHTYPNPFNATTTISFALPESQPVRLDIYNMLGQRVVTLIDQELAEGEYNQIWLADDCPSGIYFARLDYGDVNKSIKMILLK